MDTDQMLKETRESSRQSTSDADRIIEEMEKKSIKMEEMSINNFAEWRNYLHKYYVLILALIVGTGIFEKNISEAALGIWISLGGVFLGFIVINLYLYFERRWIAITTHISATNPYQLYEHPNVKDHIVEAMKLNVKEVVLKDEKQLEKLRELNPQDKKEIDYLVRKIKVNKKLISWLKYYGQQFDWIENFWLIGISISILATMVGSVMIINFVIYN